MPNIALVLNRDLLFGSRIRGALAALGLEARFFKTADDFVAALNEVGSASAIGIVDMNDAVSWTVLGDAQQTSVDWPPLLAFGPHTDVENRRAAKEAGMTRIVSNGQFHRDMKALIERYRRE